MIYIIKQKKKQESGICVSFIIEGFELQTCSFVFSEIT